MLATERGERHTLRWVIVIVVLAVVAFLAAIAIQRNAFPYYSGDHDEPVYRFQAEMLRDGHITLPGAQNEFFRPWLSGPGADDRLVMAFNPGWPAVLMVSEVTTGTMLVALGFAAALTVIASFAFARELLGSTPRAVLATAILTLSPFTLMLSGTYLNYAFAVALYLVFGAVLLRGLQRDAPVLLVVAGLVLGAAFVTRNFDAVLFALPFAGYVVATRRHELRSVVRIGAWVALGLAPALIGALAYNAATSGSPLTFPTTTQSEGVSAFGWGIRSIAPDTPELNFNFIEAVSSMGTNLWALPTWLFGTYFTLALAAFGAWRLWREQRAICGLLLGLTFIFPVAYITWWASSLTTNGAMNGLGPHYYLPVLVPVAILAAHGAGEAYDALGHRRGLLIGGLVLAVAFTAVVLPPKIQEKRDTAEASRKYARDVEQGLRQRDGDPALVIQERRQASYIMEPYPFLANPPDLDAAVLYARDRGARTIELLERRPDRRAYRLVRELEPGKEIGQLPVVVKPQSVVRGRAVSFRATIENTTGKPAVYAYVRSGRRTLRRLLDTDSAAGERYEVTWTLSPEGLEYTGPPAPASRVRSKRRPGGLAIGASFGRTPRTKDPDAAERRYYVRTQGHGASGSTEVLTADEQWTRFGTPIHAWLPIAVDGTLNVDLTGSG